MLYEKPLKDIFPDHNYAWDLLEYEIKLELSSQICSEDVSKMLQIYMRGVQRMNSETDIRQSFFKNRVSSLMSRPNVLKILNKTMTKKNKSPVIEPEPQKILDSKIQIKLQQKRKEMQMRIAYGTQEHTPDTLQKMLTQQNKKQSSMTSKINKIVNSHEERLMNRIKERKLRTMTAKSRPDMYHHDEKGTPVKLSKEMLLRKRDEQQFGKPQKMVEVEGKKQRKVCSVSPPRSSFQIINAESPVKTKRRVTMDHRDIKIPVEFD